MPPRPNVAQRAARWSAEHRRIAILGWIAVVIASVFIGSAVGTKHIADEDLGVGESRQADQILADAGFNDRASEQVLLQPTVPGMTVSDPRFVLAIRDVVQRLEEFPTIVDVKSPLQLRNSGQISEDRRSALVTFDIKGDSDLTEERVGPIRLVVENAAGDERARPVSWKPTQLADEAFMALWAELTRTDAYPVDSPFAAYCLAEPTKVMRASGGSVSATARRNSSIPSLIVAPGRRLTSMPIAARRSKRGNSTAKDASTSSTRCRGRCRDHCRGCPSRRTNRPRSSWRAAKTKLTAWRSKRCAPRSVNAIAVPSCSAPTYPPPH